MRATPSPNVNTLGKDDLATSDNYRSALCSTVPHCDNRYASTRPDRTPDNACSNRICASCTAKGRESPSSIGARSLSLRSASQVPLFVRRRFPFCFPFLSAPIRPDHFLPLRPPELDQLAESRTLLGTRTDLLHCPHKNHVCAVPRRPPGISQCLADLRPRHRRLPAFNRRMRGVVFLPFPHASPPLHGIFIDRGSSGRPAVVIRTDIPHVEHSIRKCPQRRAGYGRSTSQTLLCPFEISMSTPSGYLGSGLHFGSTPLSHHSIFRFSVLMLRIPAGT